MKIMHEEIKPFNDPRWNILINKFKEKIQEDNKHFKYDSTYVELPEICFKPEFCLISMEPGPGNGDKEIKYRNFIANKRDFILNYCAYNYLGTKGFNYQITDMAKGGISIKEAKETQSERYNSWKELLNEELELLGNPKIIFIGKGLYEQNIKKKYLDVKDDFYILHHSGANTKHVNNYYNEKNLKNQEKLDDNIKDDVKKIAKKLMKAHNYSIELEDEILNKYFKKDFTEQDKRLIIVYKYKFEQITKEEKNEERNQRRIY